MNITDLSKRVDQLKTQGEAALQTRHIVGGHYETLNSGKMAGFRSASLSFIERVYGNKHPHYLEFRKSTDGSMPHDAECGISILSAIKDELDGGWLFSVKGLVAAELFADFIEMSEHLLDSGYKDPAAVMAGSVLEENLRQLCIKNNLPVEEAKGKKTKPINADRLNSELSKSQIYSKLDLKNVTAWLDLRNKAAHGKYDEYTEAQVKNMISGITEFLSRVSI